MAFPLLTSSGPFTAVSGLLQTSLRVEKDQWLPPDELAVRRQVRLRQVLAAAARTRYYGAVLRDALGHRQASVVAGQLTVLLEPMSTVVLEAMIANAATPGKSTR